MNDDWSLIPALLLSAVFLVAVLLRLMQQFSPPLNAAKLVLIGRGYSLLGRMNEALQESRLAVEMDPENAEAHVLLGHLLLQTGNAAQAAFHFRQSTHLEPLNHSYWRDLGIVLLVLSVRKNLDLRARDSLLEETARAFCEAYRLAPENLQNRMNLQMIQQSLGFSPSLHIEEKEGVLPAPLLQFYSGEISEIELFQRLESEPGECSLGNAHFNVALYSIIKGDEAGARRNLRWCNRQRTDLDGICGALLRCLET